MMDNSLTTNHPIRATSQPRATSHAPRATIWSTWLDRAVIVLPPLVAVLLGVLFISSIYGTSDDDGYIFYQYARNLADGRGLSFNPGEISYGVTSGAWVGLLAAVHALLRLDIILEAQGLGLGLFALSAALWARAVARWTERPLLGLLGGLAYVLELDALKASIIGLETGLNLAAIAALACLVARRPWERPLLLGAVCGLAVATRPDNAVWVALALAVSLLRERPALLKLGGVAGAAAVIAGPWYGWLWWATGAFIPPTQTGKLLVFAPMNLNITLSDFQHLSLGDHLALSLRETLNFVIGGGLPTRLAFGGLALLALATVALAARPATRRHAAWPAFLVLSVIAQLGVYTWSFPLLKLRYLVNVLPVGVAALVGALGLLILDFGFSILESRRAKGATATPNLIPKSKIQNLKWAGLVVGLLVLLAGGVLYSREVGRQIANHRYYVSVQSVRRDVGLWLRDNTPAGSLVALEPIGDIAFYSGRRVLDMGGLTDTTTWPALQNGYRDGAALAELISSRHTNFLVDYTDIEGVGGVSNALAALPGAKPVAVIESQAAQDGTRGEYGSYTIYSLPQTTR